MFIKIDQIMKRYYFFIFYIVYIYICIFILNIIYILIIIFTINFNTKYYYLQLYY